MLNPYRVLDLTDEKGLLCGKLLGDLGADVIKVEKPGGDPARMIGPFYHDEVHPEKSLFWWAFNTSKRGITLDIESAEGRDTFRNLVRNSDFVIESFPPGYMDKLGLGYPELEKINPGVIMVSISPFGQSGPYRDYKAPHIVAWAMGGAMYEHGDPDRAPITISHHSHAYLHAGAEAAVAATMALHHREITGEGQHVDVSIQESVAHATFLVIATWDMMRIVQKRGGLSATIPIRLGRIWECKDGHIVWFYFGGLQAKRFNIPLIQWMDREGMASDFLKNFDWDTFDFATSTQEMVDRLEDPVRKFFMTHTKAELLEGAFKYRVMLYPVSTSEDMLRSYQLTARDFWMQVEHPELGASFTYPGPFTHSSEAPSGVLRRAPLIGEHNREILGNESRYSDRRADSVTEGARKSVKKASTGKLLEGIRVVSFTWAITGARTAKTLADYGAEVIRIEAVSAPDPHRLAAPYKDGVLGLNRGGMFNQDNTSRLSAAINLAHPKGVEVARRLIARADIVMENFAPGVMNRLGLSYDELRKVKPDIIMLSTCMQGQTGPHATHAGYGYHLTALSGISHVAGWPDREPPWLGPYTDYVAPHFNVLAIMAALDYRRRTGKGQFIDMSQYENGVQFGAPLILDYAVNGRVAGKTGNRCSSAAPHGAYRCRGDDRWCAIAVTTAEEWRSFCGTVGNPEWSKDPRFSTIQTRKENEDELDRLVEEWSINHPDDEVIVVMQAAGVGAGVLQTGEDLMEHDPQLKHRHFFFELDHPEMGKYRAPRPSFLLSKSPCGVWRAPLLGEHNEHVLKQLLGMSDDEIADLIVDKVVE